jgi:inosose dehydratase
MSTNTLPFRFGNECYTWFMSGAGATHANRLEHMIEITARAGMTGIEPIHFWMGDLSDPQRLAAVLEKHQVQLAAIALVLEWNHAVETEHERAEADRVIDLLTQFRGALLCTVQMPTGRDDLMQRRKSLTANLNAVSRRAADRGVSATFHPNSPPTSINRTSEDYDVILNGLDPQVTGWTPDVGHIINGGMDPLATMQQWRPLINHVHFKDWDGQPEFTLMGAGKVDLVGVTKWMKSWNYSGWIICEDEAEQAIDDPDGVTLHDGRWIRETLIPAIA